MRFLLTMIVAIILLKLFLPEIARPVFEILGNLLSVLATFLEHLLESVPSAY